MAFIEVTQYTGANSYYRPKYEKVMLNIDSIHAVFPQGHGETCIIHCGGLEIKVEETFATVTSLIWQATAPATIEHHIDHTPFIKLDEGSDDASR